MTSKIQQLAENAMGWKLAVNRHLEECQYRMSVSEPKQVIRIQDGCYSEWLPEESDADAMELLAKMLKDKPCGLSIHGEGEGFGIVAKYDAYQPTLRAAIVAFACKLYGIKE